MVFVFRLRGTVKRWMAGHSINFHRNKSIVNEQKVETFILLLNRVFSAHNHVHQSTKS
jgi:hypothetical protein